MKYSIFLIATLAMIGTSSLFAKSANIKVDVSLFPVGSFDAVSEQIEGKLNFADGKYQAKEIKVKVESLDTGISLRDEHMHERLRFKEHPHVIVSDIEATGDKGNAKINIGGILKPIKFTLKKLDDSLVEVQFPLHLPDFNIEDINYRGVGVEDDIEVIAQINVEAK